MGEKPASGAIRGRAAGLAVTLLMHGVALYALVAYRPVSPAVTLPAPIMVSFVQEAEPTQPEAVVQLQPEAVVQLQPQAVVQPKPQAVVQPKPQAVVEKKPKPKPVKREPVAAPAPKRPAVIAAVTPEPAPQSAPLPLEAAPSEPAPRRDPAPAPAPASAPAAAAVVARAATPSPIPPRFDADYLRNPAPRYPPLARRMHQEGKVVVRVLVNSGGSPAKVEVRSSSGSEVLDDAALDVVRRWRFVPARQGEQPVDAWVLVPITFTLQG